MTSDGSSPRVRGTGINGDEQRGHQRFIPACAGNGPGQWHVWRLTSVHPRVCGERYNARAVMMTCPGSSPRVRGTAAEGEHLPAVARFIPACAGNGRSAAPSAA